jgi:hypothetical protein
MGFPTKKRQLPNGVFSNLVWERGEKVTLRQNMKSDLLGIAVLRQPPFHCDAIPEGQKDQMTQDKKQSVV